ncbi:MAG: universal stress protein [Rhodobacteraceae bacterium]|nr:universal stress protein [Paracoccaceae bacterium]
MYKKILVPVAFDHGETTTKAVEVAQYLVDKGGQVTALHVVEPVPGYIAQYLPEGGLEANREAVTAQMKQTLGDAAGVDVDVISGYAGTAITEYAGKHGFDCIVIASHRPGIEDYFLGSTAARVVRHAQMPVHVVR